MLLSFKFQYSTKVYYKKESGEFEQVLSAGPLDPCTEEMAALRKEHDAVAMQHGNMSLDHICPFKKVIGNLILRYLLTKKFFRGTTT